MNDRTNEPCGILLLDKPSGFTSQDAVNVVRRLFHTRSCGHTGTLDPMATGLLVVLIGRAVKASEYAMAHGKSYVAGLRLGITTDTEDTTGEIITQTDEMPPESAVIDAIMSMKGDSMQTPPMFSAKKVGGHKLVDIARSGGEVERKPVPITVSEISAERVSDSEYTLKASVSKGTYIRTLCADIGKKIGCGAAMSSLRRVSCGGFSVLDARTLDDLENMDLPSRVALLRDVWELFPDAVTLSLPAFYDRLAKNGAEIYQSKIGTHLPVGTRVALCDDDGRYALAEVMTFDAGTAIKPVKVLRG